VQMGEEYYHARDYTKALALLGVVTGDYRKEKWWSLLTAMLCTSLRCAYLLANIQEYLTICIELMGQYALHYSDERTRIQMNLIRVISGDSPDHEPGCDVEAIEEAKELWKASMKQGPHLINIQMSNIAAFGEHGGRDAAFGASQGVTAAGADPGATKLASPILTKFGMHFSLDFICKPQNNVLVIGIFLQIIRKVIGSRFMRARLPGQMTISVPPRVRHNSKFTSFTEGVVSNPLDEERKFADDDALTDGEPIRAAQFCTFCNRSIRNLGSPYSKELQLSSFDFLQMLIFLYGVQQGINDFWLTQKRDIIASHLHKISNAADISSNSNTTHLRLSMATRISQVFQKLTGTNLSLVLVSTRLLLVSQAYNLTEIFAGTGSSSQDFLPTLSITFSISCSWEESMASSFHIIAILLLKKYENLFTTCC
ncbi:Hypothetical predicted protein, partial [Paramuricea clavata]